MKIKKKTFTLLYSIILVLSIFLAIYSSYLFVTGSHNVDLGQNLRFINAEYKLNLVDLNSMNEEWSASEMYFYGQYQMTEAFVLLGISVFLIGFSLKGVIEER